MRVVLVGQRQPRRLHDTVTAADPLITRQPGRGRHQPPPAGGSALPESPLSAGMFCGSSSSKATTSTSISAAASVAYSGSSSANPTSWFPVMSRTYQHARSASPRRKHPRTSQHDAKPATTEVEDPSEPPGSQRLCHRQGTGLPRRLPGYVWLHQLKCECPGAAHIGI